MKRSLQNLSRLLLLAGTFWTWKASGQTVWTYQPTNAFPALVFSNPVCLAYPPGETNRLFIVEKRGRIIVITNLAAPTRTIFLDISSRVRVGNTSESANVNGEEGLLGLAFHPGYTTNRHFFVFYTRTNGSLRFDTLSRFQIFAGNTNLADPDSELRFLEQTDEAVNHNGGDIRFGPDGYLYVPLGDEGGSDDFFNNSQTITNDFFSAILRLDVDKRPGNLNPNPHPAVVGPTNYWVPVDNPFVGATQFNGVTISSNTVRTEFWVVGMRNPWRVTYDASSDRWYCADVGQGQREEVDILQRGGNYGWAYREGTINGPKTAPGGFVSIAPIFDYGHTNGGFGNRVSIIGGVAYHGSRLPMLNNAYIYADYGSGEVWALHYNGAAVTANTLILTNKGISAFGIDPSNGDVLYAALRSGSNSLIQRIISTNTMPVFTTATLSGTNLIVSGTNGLPGGNYYVLTSTNLALPATNWLRAATNPFNAGGNFNFTNPFNLVSNLFYRLQVQ